MRQITELRYIGALFLMLLCWQSVASSPKDRIDLSGEWDVIIHGEGKDGKIMLPGTLNMAGYGVEVDTLALSKDEQFRRLTRRHSYIGPATYSRSVVITEEMAGKPLELSLERVIWNSKASIGGKAFDNEEVSLIAPHRHILREGLPAGEYRLEIVVDNSRRYDISAGNLDHCYTNDTQTIWNGILGEISLRMIPPTDLSRVEIYPSYSLDSLRIDAYVRNSTSSLRKEKVSFSIGRIRKTVKERLHPGENKISIVLPAEGLARWNEFNPVMHEVNVAVGQESKDYRFGIRSVDNKNGLRVNGIPVFLRGTLECCVFPLTGTPPTDRKGWINTFSKAREWGLNHLRFHSWCPPEAAFQVADSLGFYLQVELPVWSLNIGDDAEAESFLRDEFERIVENYGNHPSLCLLSVGNELQHDFNWLNETVALMKKRDPRRLYTTTSFTFENGHGGHPEPEDQFYVTQWTDNGWVRGQGVFETERPAFNKNYDSSLKGVDVPLISHEIGQYAVYPHMTEIEKYTGVLNPLNFKNIRHDLQKKGLLGESEAMTMASCNLAAILYKEEIERALKTKGMSGFQLLGLQDFPGQGTALVGLADAFWDNKGAVSEGWFREFCSPVVPLLDFDSAIYGADDEFEGKIMIVNYTDKPIHNGDMSWSLTIEDSGQILASGKVSYPEIPAGASVNTRGFRTSLTDVGRSAAVIARLSMPDGSSNS